MKKRLLSLLLCLVAVLALLPQEREFITDDGLMGTLTLKLDTVQEIGRAHV